MFGLVGIMTNQYNCDNDILMAMVGCLSHRGPDVAGTQIIDFENARVCLCTKIKITRS